MAVTMNGKPKSNLVFGIVIVVFIVLVVAAVIVTGRPGKVNPEVINPFVK